MIKPNQKKSRYPPVIDKFSRTPGAPISSMKSNLSSSSRIASNMTQTAKYLYLDLDEKCVKALKSLDNTVNFKAYNEYLQKCASLKEELLYVVYKVHKYLNLL